MDNPPTGLNLGPRSRRTLAAVAAGLAATLAPRPPAKARRRRRNRCDRKNVCLNAAHTCKNGKAKCYVKAFGGNVCGKLVGTGDACSGCIPGEVCVFVTGGGCGTAGDFGCVLPAS